MNREAFNAWLKDSRREPLIMGVLNVTPDSFSDGGQYLRPSDAVPHARQMAAAGAAMIDIGGESTRPGSESVSPLDQIRRVVPVIEAIVREQLPAMISVDTTKWAVARAALDAGAMIVNDVSAGRDDSQMLPGVASRGAPIVLMHMLGTPRTMQDNPHYSDVVGEVESFLLERAAAARHAGVPPHNVLLDPGIGFGKTLEHNLDLLRATRRLADAMPGPLVVGPSRKRFIGTITNEPAAERRVFGTAAVVAYCATNGAAVARVHDVGPMYQVVRTIRAIQTGANPA